MQLCSAVRIRNNTRSGIVSDTTRQHKHGVADAWCARLERCEAPQDMEGLAAAETHSPARPTTGAYPRAAGNWASMVVRVDAAGALRWLRTDSLRTPGCQSPPLATL